MLERFKQIFKKSDKIEQKAMYPYLQSQLWLLNPPAYSPAKYRTYAYEGYMSNPIVYRCINLIATAVAGIPWKLYRKVGPDQDLHVTESPVLDLLCKPNPLTGQADFFTNLISYLQMSGNVYVQAVGPKNGPPRELYLLRNDRITIEQGYCDTICYNEITPTYYYECDGTKQILDPKTLWHGKFWNPLCDFYGLSPLSACAKSIDQLNSSLDWNVALLQNSANPSGVLTAEGNLTDEQVSRLKEQMSQKYQSSRNAGRPMVLDGGLDWKQMSLTPHEMEWNIGQQMATKFISVSLGVDPVLLGDSQNRTYATFHDAEKSFYTSTVLPNLDRLRDDFLNGWLLPLFPGMENMYFNYDRDEIEVLADDREAVWNRVLSGLEAGLISMAEAREAIGYTELDETDGKEIPQKQKKKVVKAFNINSLNTRAFVEKVEGLRNEWDKRAKRKVIKQFRIEEKAVLEAIGSASKSTALRAARDAITSGPWYSLYKWLYTNVMSEFALQTARSYKERKYYEELPEEYLQEIEEFVYEVVGDRVAEVLETTRDRVTKIILAILASGGGITEILQEIAILYRHDIPIRSSAISQTEVITAGNAATSLMAKLLGAVKKQWVTVGDDKVRPSHQAMEGVVVDFNDPYPNGLRYPGDPNAPAEEVINCRCVESYIL